MGIMSHEKNKNTSNTNEVDQVDYPYLASNPFPPSEFHYCDTQPLQFDETQPLRFDNTIETVGVATGIEKKSGVKKKKK